MANVNADQRLLNFKNEENVSFTDENITIFAILLKLAREQNKCVYFKSNRSKQNKKSLSL